MNAANIYEETHRAESEQKMRHAEELHQQELARGPPGPSIAESNWRTARIIAYWTMALLSTLTLSVEWFYAVHP